MWTAIGAAILKALKIVGLGTIKALKLAKTAAAVAAPLAGKALLKSAPYVGKSLVKAFQLGSKAYTTSMKLLNVVPVLKTMPVTAKIIVAKTAPVLGVNVVERMTIDKIKQPTLKTIARTAATPWIAAVKLGAII